MCQQVAPTDIDVKKEEEEKKKKRKKSIVLYAAMAVGQRKLPDYKGENCSSRGVTE